ncbi:MAG: DUF192 domain-containing protein [Anaerolineales bacterium]|nr:DUF192 domain-containing protein [Anaerolineales bacterium]
MTIVRVHNLDRPLKPCLKVNYCERFMCRLRGLMFHPPLGREEGLVLVGTRQNRRDAAIHMFFMRMDLTVVWLNTAYEVVDVQIAKRWRPVYTPAKPAQYTLEISTDWISAFQVGDRLAFEPVEKNQSMVA